jgi:hypothetical protein
MFSTSFQNSQFGAVSARKPLFGADKGMCVGQPQADVFVSSSVAVPENERITLVPEQPIICFLEEDLTKNKISQGEHANCYFWSAIGRLLHQPDGIVLLNTISIKEEFDVRKGKEVVTIHFAMVDRSVEFDLDELGQPKNGQHPAEAPRVLQMLELAYMKLSRSRRNGELESPYPDDGAGYTGYIANYGYSSEVLTEMFGGIPFVVDTSRFKKRSYDKSFSDFGSRGIDLARKELKHIEKNQQDLYIYTALTPNRPEPYTSIRYDDGEIAVQNKHSYAITHVDLVNNAITIWDPEPSTGIPQTQVITLEEFCEFFGTIEGIYFSRASLLHMLV